jgi:hypothetical protein
VKRPLIALVPVLTLALVAGAGCSRQTVDSDRLRLLGAIPPGAVERGVYLYEPGADDDVLPGSLAGPDLAPLLERADLVAETAAPPLVVAIGVPEGDLPEDAEIVDGVLVAGAEPDEAAEARARLEKKTNPKGILLSLAAADSPVGWAGPASVANHDAGELKDAIVTLWPDWVVFGAEVDDADRASGATQDALRNGSLPSSPGKTWTSLLTESEVTVDNAGDLLVTAVPEGFPGLLLRQLIDSGSLTFLTSG